MIIVQHPEHGTTLLISIMLERAGFAVRYTRAESVAISLLNPACMAVITHSLDVCHAAIPLRVPAFLLIQRGDSEKALIGREMQAELVTLPLMYHQFISQVRQAGVRP